MLSMGRLAKRENLLNKLTKKEVQSDGISKVNSK